MSKRILNSKTEDRNVIPALIAGGVFGTVISATAGMLGAGLVDALICYLLITAIVLAPSLR